MELSSTIGLRLIIAAALILTALGLFGISWPIRLRILASMAIGTVVIGFFAWPLAKPSFPLGAITLFSGDITPLDIIIYALIAFAVGLAAYLACYPYGLQIAPIAVPTGLSIWALRSGSMMSLLQLNNTFTQRQTVYSIIRFEGFLWLTIIAAGYLGVLTAARFHKKHPQIPLESQNHKAVKNKNLYAVLALVICVIISQIATNLLAQDVRIFDSRLGSVTGQPANAQIAFAVFAAFVLAAFCVRTFFVTGFIIPAIATACVTYFTVAFFSAKGDVLAHMIETWPAAFFSRPSCGVLPIQFVSFGTIGSVAGYWIGALYEQWRKEGQ